MKTVHRWLKPILAVAMLVLLASCASYIPTDSTVGNMSIEQAKKELTWKGERIGISTLLNADGKRHSIARSRVTSSVWIITDEMGIETAIRFKMITEISLENNILWLRGKDKVKVFDVYSLPDYTYFINAIYVLKQNSIHPKNDNEYDARFASSLTDYRNKVASNAALPEDANRYKVQAEGAVRDKQFDDAADLYAEALKIAPWWPVGHFNRALVLGETGDYEMAIREMKRYLQLVPDAPNARAAQDKMYDWERKTGDGN